jgi:hypothetical protein
MPSPPKPKLPPLSVPLPGNLQYRYSDGEFRPDMSQIRMCNAVNFVQFCKDSSVKAMQVTWDELDHITAEDQAGKHKRARDKGLCKDLALNPHTALIPLITLLQIVVACEVISETLFLF